MPTTPSRRVVGYQSPLDKFIAQQAEIFQKTRHEVDLGPHAHPQMLSTDDAISHHAADDQASNNLAAAARGHHAQPDDDRSSTT